MAQPQKKFLTLDRFFSSDTAFDSLFPEPIQRVAAKHWTPLSVAKKAAEFLSASSCEKVLDIGSGSGKFCLAASYYHPEITFVGIEQREELVELSNSLKSRLKLKNVSFKNENLSEISLEEYDHFYFYNSFYENIEGTEKIDESVFYSEKLYDYYNLYLYKQLNKKPAGTRLVTYHSFGNEIPPGYEIVSTDFDEYLKFWIKV
ncbi:MAG: methyltransferase domain-containing protein [Ginsengibacter sp.]